MPFLDASRAFLTFLRSQDHGSGARAHGTTAAVCLFPRSPDRLIGANFLANLRAVAFLSRRATYFH